ncbi:MAG: hypothetical protein NT069_22435 [Planctomycetota bacterium]|nr:hypothetical protein [Planctomycetota bacterium]
MVHLPQRQANVLRWRCGFESPPETLGEIAAKIGVTRERVRQIEKQATKALLRQVAIERAKRAARHAAVQTPSPIEMALPMAFINRETFHSIPIRRIHDPVTESRLRGAETPISSAEEIEECRHRYVTVGIENSQVGKSLPHGFVFRGRGIRHVLSWTRLWTLLIHHIFIHDRDLILRQMQLGPRRSKIAQLFTRYRWEAGMRAHVLAKQVNVHPGVSSIRQRELVRLLIAAGRFPPDDLMIILRKVRESTDSNCEPEGGDRS